MNTQASNQPRTMIANFAAKVFLPLPDDITNVNVSRLRLDLSEMGASISYPSLLKLMRGMVEKVNGFELVKVQHYQPPMPQMFKPIDRPVLHRETDKVPVPVIKGSTPANILSLLVRGVHSNEMLKKFPKALNETQMLADVQYYANHYGYDLNYSSQDHIIQLVLPTGMDDIAYVTPEVEPAPY